MRARLAIAVVAIFAPAPAWAQSGTEVPSGLPPPEINLPREFNQDAQSPALIFFPPTPPPIDRTVSPPLAPAPRGLAPPEGMGAYVDEPFYPQLSTRFAQAPLSAKQLARLMAYDTARAAAYEELRAEIARHDASDAATRQRAFAELARRQAPRLAELEKDAETIRDDFLAPSADWRELRHWTLGARDSQRGDSPWEIAQVMRAYGYYQDGLSAAQRRLLREIALELAMATADAGDAARVPFTFFSPEPARIMLPDTLPPALADKIGDYQTRKSALKTELYEAVYAADKRNFLPFRTTSFRRLAARQAPGFAALEALAEEIRVALAQLPGGGRTQEVSPLPGEFTARIVAWIDQRDSLQRATIATINRMPLGAQLRIPYSFEGSGLRFLVVPLPGALRPDQRGTAAAERLHEIIEATRLRMESIAADYAQQLAELINAREALRREAAALLPSSTPAEVSNAIATAVRVSEQQEHRAAFHEYHIATLEPGLSIEQRRLLFGHAIERLNLPLPPGELQPTVRAASW